MVGTTAMSKLAVACVCGTQAPITGASDKNARANGGKVGNPVGVKHTESKLTLKRRRLAWPAPQRRVATRGEDVGAVDANGVHAGSVNMFMLRKTDEIR
jgi:hypothetical protein